MQQDLTIIPVINKIDLPSADVPNALKQLEDITAIPAEEAIPASAKMGLGIEDILEAVVQRVPAPNISGQGVELADPILELHLMFFAGTPAIFVIRSL